MKTYPFFTLFLLISVLSVYAEEPLRKAFKKESVEQRVLSVVSRIKSDTSLSLEQETLLKQAIETYEREHEKAYFQAQSDSTAVDFSRLVAIYETYQSSVDSILTESQKKELTIKQAKRLETERQLYIQTTTKETSN